MNSLEIIPIRINNQIDWDKIDNNIDFPSLFKVFNNTFLINKIFDSDKTKYYDQSLNRKRSLGVFHSKLKQSLVIDSFFDPTEIPKQLELLLDVEDEIDKEALNRGFIPFAYCPSEQLLMVCTEPSYSDGIYLFTRWNDTPLELISENIFDFFQNFVLNIDEASLNLSTNDLYRNWRENFWRIREDETT